MRRARPALFDGTHRGVWDDAAAESFWSTFKNEYYHRHVFATIADARRGAYTWIDDWYNARRRRPSTASEEDMTTDKHYQDLSDWAENLNSDDLATTTVHTSGEGAALGRAMLEAALGRSDAVDRALGGRPSLSKAGTSPSRTVRLPRELARVEGCKPSAVVRDAVGGLPVPTPRQLTPKTTLET